jgi:hypothetical protein
MRKAVERLKKGDRRRDGGEIEDIESKRAERYKHWEGLSREGKQIQS